MSVDNTYIPADIKRRLKYHCDRLYMYTYPGFHISKSSRDYSMGYLDGLDMHKHGDPEDYISGLCDVTLSSPYRSESYKGGLRSFMKDSKRIKWDHTFDRRF